MYRNRRSTSNFRRFQNTKRSLVIQRAKTNRLAYLRRLRMIRRTNYNTGPVREEKKWLDTTAGNSPANTTGLVTLLNGIANGSTYQTREGRQCWIKNIQIRGYMYPEDTGTEPTRGDLYIIYDKQPGSTVPAITDVLNQATSSSFINLNNRDRFLILAHRSFIVGKQDATATQSLSPNPGTQKVDIYLKCNLKETFKGDTNAITDISYGAIYILTIGSQVSGAGANFWISTRIRFAEK